MDIWLDFGGYSVGFDEYLVTFFGRVFDRHSVGIFGGYGWLVFLVGIFGCFLWVLFVSMLAQRRAWVFFYG